MGLSGLRVPTELRILGTRRLLSTYELVPGDQNKRCNRVKLLGAFGRRATVPVPSR